VGEVAGAIGLVRRGSPKGRPCRARHGKEKAAKGLSRGAEFPAPRFLASPQVLASLRKPSRSEDNAQSAGIAPHLADPKAGNPP
jgi:hypothetical protein